MTQLALKNRSAVDAVFPFKNSHALSLITVFGISQSVKDYKAHL